ncbi:zinc finger protein 260-like [Hippoglossus stenolepis]|uniref:zinc finger protein 260-like n=1 Tax=Hippoglossus stenolepis TaxID=195615 RepID=UPI001FB02712|nr:zinc finger protein 260-like [Hippoglossus stenolepis]
MPFPSAFGSQLAAIMDVLAKAAVAEISKLVEDGTVVLRLEMCRRDVEIQELKRSLKLMEVELCKAREAAETRTTEEEQEKEEQEEEQEQEQAARTQVPSTDEREDEQTRAGYLEPKAADSLCKHRHGNQDGDDMRPAVKHEPAGELVLQEATDNTATAATSVCFEVGERSDSIWPPAACGMFEKSSVAMQQQQHGQMFPSHAEQFSAHRNTESSYNSPTATQESADASTSVPIKVETEIQPVCSAGTTSQSVGNEPSRQVSRPAASENQCLQSPPQQTGRSPAVPPVPRSAAATEDHILSRNNLRTKRLMNVWRANQKLFICSVCNKGFPRLSQLEEHKATHQLFKPFRCLECGKSFTQKTRLKTHQSVHTGERPFSCTICGKMFSRQDNCTRHERFHSGLKPYSCGQCGKSFTVLGNLKIHQEIHLQGR